MSTAITGIALIFVGLPIWMVIGCALLSQVDDEEGRVLAWAVKCPFGGLGVVVLAWPITFPLAFFLRWRQL